MRRESNGTGRWLPGIVIGMALAVLGTPDGDPISWTFGINEQGDIVGTSRGLQLAAPHKPFIDTANDGAQRTPADPCPWSDAHPLEQYGRETVFRASCSGTSPHLSR